MTTEETYASNARDVRTGWPSLSDFPPFRQIGLWRRLFRYPGLAGRSAFWTAVLGAGMAGAISLYMHLGAVDILKANARENLASAVEASGDRFSGSLNRLIHDVIFLSKTPPVQGLVQGSRVWRGQASVPAAFWRDRLAETFIAMIESRPQYLQVRLIGLADDGREIVRVERGAGGRVRRVGETGLQHKGDRAYFRQAVKAAHDGVHISDIELNREHGKIQEPHTPVLRVAAPVFGPADRLFGIVVINVDAGWLFTQIAGKPGAGRKWFVTNRGGDYLFGPDPAKTFGFDLGHRHLVQEDFPALSRVFTAADGTYSGFQGAGSDAFLAAARRVALDPARPDRHLVIGSLEPVGTLLGEINRQRRDIALIAAALILCGSVIAVGMARAVARPLRQMTSAASDLAQGRREVDLGAFLQRRDETGELANAFATMAREIGEREERLMVQTRELSRSNEELAQFAYVASHDLQEPLRMVGSYLELLDHRSGDRLDAEAREFIGYAIDGAARMKQLINDLLDYSRSGSRELAREPVDFGAVVANVLRILDGQVKNCDARIEVAPMPTVRADAIQIERVFMNLIENAIKYRSDKPPHIRVGAERVARGWRFAVIDNGIGIEPRFRDKVFEIFRRLHGRERYSGTGIGLAVVKLVVERHGGTIALEPVPGGGSSFIFTLPD